MAFPQPSNLTNPNTAPLPTPPPRPERNRRGLRADTTAPSYRSNVSTFHGQVTLLPPPNMVRVRQGRSSPYSTDLTSASSSRSVLEAVDEQASTSGSAPPARRRRKRREGGGDGVDGREDIVLKPLQTASEAIRERYRRSEAAMRAPHPPQAPPPAPSSSSASTAHVRRARARVGMNLDRGASMRRRNVQEDVVAPTPLEDDSDLTPTLPPPSYIQSRSSPLVLGSRIPAEPPPSSNELDPSPPYPTSSNSLLQPRPTSPIPDPPPLPTQTSPIPSSPPPSYLPPVVEEAPPAEVVEPRVPESLTTEVPLVVEPLSLSRRIWDEMVREGIGFEERIRRMRAWETAGESEGEEEETSEDQAALSSTTETTTSPSPPLPLPPTPPRPVSAPPPTSSPPRRPTTERVPSLPSFSWQSEPAISLDLTSVVERPAPTSLPPSLPSLPRLPLFTSHYDPIAHLLASASSSTPSITPSPSSIDASTSSPDLNLTPPTPITTRPASQPWSRQGSFEHRIRSPLAEEVTPSRFSQEPESRPSPSRSSSPGEAPPLPPRPPANPPPAILLRLSRRRRPPPPPPARRPSAQTIHEGIAIDDSPNSLPPSSWDPPPLSATRRPPTPPPSLPHPHALASVPPSRRPPAPPPPTPPPPPSRPPLNGTSSSLSSPHLQLPRRTSAVSVSSSSISEYPSGLQSPIRPGSSTGGTTRQSWNGTERRREGAHEGDGGRPAWAARPLPPVPPPTTMGNVGAGSGREETLESLRGESVGEQQQQLQPQPFEITDLDLLVSQLDQNANQFEAAQVLETFLSPSVPAHLSPHELSLLPHHPIVELSRRTTKAGKTKIKLSWNDQRVDRCSFGCLSVFKAEEMAVGLSPGCGHVGHEECARRWFEGSRRCPVCREEVGELEGGGEAGTLI